MSSPAPWVQALLDWYARQGRALPWRRAHPDPYAVWVSEIMLQQTRVETVEPYFRRWMDRFPTVRALAQADEQEVLRLWEGLGYYRRARQLLAAAREVVARYGGQVPADPAELARLPGIGPYTAAAIASIAYGRDALALDGNLRRVLARFFGVETPVDTPAGQRELAALAQGAWPAGRAGDFNQALMDLGALVCTPRAPRCEDCPLRPWCRAYAEGRVADLPRKRGRARVPHHTVVAGVARRGETVLLAQRPAHKMLGGLWEFPGGKVEPGEDLAAALRREWREELGVDAEPGPELGVFRHAYSHFRITLHALSVLRVHGEPRPLQAAAVRWVPVSELASYPMGKVDRAIARQLQSSS
ncbi:MAG: A/G-specific adenine glycosylase [Chloroflexi bacterium]|nr:A/G-specific adenine glycosylase [Chloroflexota bacterium]